MIEHLLERINALMSVNHLGDIHGDIFQKVFFFDNLICFLVCCVFMIGFTTDLIIKLRIRRYKRNLSQRRCYDSIDSDWA